MYGGIIMGVGVVAVSADVWWLQQCASEYADAILRRADGRVLQWVHGR